MFFLGQNIVRESRKRQKNTKYDPPVKIHHFSILNGMQFSLKNSKKMMEKKIQGANFVLNQKSISVKLKVLLLLTICM